MTLDYDPFHVLHTDTEGDLYQRSGDLIMWVCSSERFSNVNHGWPLYMMVDEAPSYDRIHTALPLNWIFP